MGVEFMMKVLKKSNGAARAREDLMGTQAAMLSQVKAELAECKENIGESLKMVRDSQSTQQEEIQNLKKAVSRGNTVVDLLAGINNATNRGAEIVTTVQGNWGILKECQDVLEKQSSSLDLLRTLASERVTRNNSLSFKQNGEGQIIAADFCQCIPEPPKLSSPNLAVSLSLAKVNDVWSATTMWSEWEYNNCERKTMGNGATIDYGYGSKTRRRLKTLDDEIWEEDVEEVSCTHLPAQCYNYQELNSPTRKSSYTQTTSFSDASSNARDWRRTQWYRVTGGAGTKLADTEVAERHCGVLHPGWIVGGHPSVSQGEVSRRIQFQNGWSMNAKIINCGSYYVYHLASPGRGHGHCTV